MPVIVGELIFIQFWGLFMAFCFQKDWIIGATLLAAGLDIGLHIYTGVWFD